MSQIARARELRLKRDFVGALTVLDKQPDASKRWLKEQLVNQIALGRLAEGITTLRQLLAVDPDRAHEYWMAIGQYENKGGNYAGAALAFGMASRGATLTATASFEYGAALANLGRHYEAVPQYRAAIAGDNKIAPRASLGLVQALAANDTFASAELSAAYQLAIVSNPTKRVLVAEWIERCTGDAEAVRSLERLQTEYQSPISSVLRALMELRGNSWVRERFSDMFQAIERTAILCAFKVVWTAHANRQSLDREACNLIVNDKEQSGALFFAFIARPITVYILPKARSPDLISSVGQSASLDELISLGINVDRLDAFCERWIDYGNEAWRDYMASAAKTGSNRTIPESLEKLSGFKDKVVAERCLQFIDPFSGEQCAPIDSVVIYGKTIYTFAGHELFYLICSEEGSNPTTIYIPRYEISIRITSRRSSAAIGPEIDNMRTMLAIRLARMPDKFEKAISVQLPVDRPRDIHLFIHKTENFAHHLWNFLTTIERLINACTHRNLARVSFHGSEFFGRIGEIFPEVADLVSNRERKAHIFDPSPYSSSALVVPAGGYFIPRSLSTRLRECMMRRPRFDRAHDPDDFAGRHTPVVWLGMRLGDKSWMGQEEGLPMIIDSIASHYPDALFLLDGFSYPVGACDVSPMWERVAGQLAEVAAAVKARSSVPDRVLSLIGNSMRENVLWAAVTDVYLAPIGSTQHKIGWFSDAPGIVYAPPLYAGGLAEQSAAIWAAEISAPPVFVIGEAAGQGQMRGLNASRKLMQNVTLDPDELAARMLTLLASRTLERI
jgi:hypothetical protein